MMTDVVSLIAMFAGALGGSSATTYIMLGELRQGQRDLRHDLTEYRKDMLRLFTNQSMTNDKLFTMCNQSNAEMVRVKTAMRAKIKGMDDVLNMD